MSEFNKLGLKKTILEVLDRLNFKEPLEVQKQIIPLILQKKNVVFTSRTGSGKTLAYTIPFLQKIKPRQGLQFLITVPTRELCIQVGKEVTRLAEPLDLKVGILYGGRDLAGDNKTTQRKNQIIIGTPGRLVQHINEKNIRVGDVQQIVFDESDQMFDNGFYDDCAYLMKRSSNDLQIVLASATITDKVEDFIRYEGIDKNSISYELWKAKKKEVNQMEKNKLYKCEICGNVTQIVDGKPIPLMCCGAEMVEMEEKVQEEGNEKHKPVMEISGNEVFVKVGSVEHPMEDFHYITMIQIFKGDKIVAMKQLAPGEKPEAKFVLEDTEGLVAKAYCNVHGFWKAE